MNIHATCILFKRVVIYEYKDDDDCIKKTALLLFHFRALMSFFLYKQLIILACNTQVLVAIKSIIIFTSTYMYILDQYDAYRKRHRFYAYIVDNSKL